MSNERSFTITGDAISAEPELIKENGKNITNSSKPDSNSSVTVNPNPPDKIVDAENIEKDIP